MQKILFLIALSMLGCARGDKVYLCNGPYSEVYHRTSHCKGLRSCSTKIQPTDSLRAKEKNRRKCGYCYQ